MRSTRLKQFLLNSDGQDLVEYSLLLAFIALAGAASIIGMGPLTTSIWSIVNSRIDGVK